MISSPLPSAPCSKRQRRHAAAGGASGRTHPAGGDRGARLVASWWLVICGLAIGPHVARAQVADGPARIRNVYIPADQLQVLFDDSSQGVLMPRDKILALWRKARSGARPAGLPSADALPQRAEYDGQLADHALLLVARIEIVKLRRGWQAVDLPFGGLAIESAQLDGQPARFGRRDDGTLFLLLREAGRRKLELAMSAPLAGRDGDLATTLRLPPVPAAEVSLRLAAGRRLQIGESVLPADSVADGWQTFRFAVDPTGRVPLVISDQFARGSRNPLVLATSRSEGHVEPAGLRWQLQLDLDVYARATDTFQLRVPGSVDIAEVEAPQLARWTIDVDADGGKLVRLVFRKPLLGRRSVRLLGLANLPMAAHWEFPTARLLGAASHTGQVVIHATPSLRVDVGTLAGIRPARLSPAAGAPPAQTTSGETFRFWDERFRLPLHVSARRRLLQASIAMLLDVGHRGATFQGSVTVSPRHAPVFGVQLQLPRAWEITAVRSGDRPVVWDPMSHDGAPATGPPQRTVRFDLDTPLRPGQSREITLTAQRRTVAWLEQDAPSELLLPELRLVGAEEVEGTLLIRAPADIDVSVVDLPPGLRPVAAEAPGDSADTAGGAGTALQYRYRDEGQVGGRLRVRAKPAKVSAETLAFVRLDRRKLDVHYQLDLHVANGRIREIRFTLPAAVGEKIQIVPVRSAVRVIEQRHTPVGGADGEEELALWHVVLDRPVTGDLTLAVDFGRTFAGGPGHNAPEAAGPEAADAADSGIPVSVPVLALQDVSRQSGILALEAASDQQIDHEPENLRELDPADVFQPRAYVPSQRIVAAYQYQRLPYRLTLLATRYPSEPVLAGICESADITSIAGRHGRMRHQARFWLRSAGLQHVPVTLPEDADLWAVLLDSEPVEVRRQQGRCVVPLPPLPADAVSDARELLLLYETRSPRLATAGLAERLRPPAFRQRAPEIALRTLDTTWHVYPPAGTDLVAAAGEFRPVNRLTRATLANRLAETIVDHSKASPTWKVASLVLAAIVVGVFSLLKTSQGWATTLTNLLVVFAVIGVLIALLLPATQSAREAARRMQCSNNLKQIGLALQNYHDVHRQFPPAAIGPHDMPRERQFSWLVALLPFLEQQALYDALRLDLPWDHPQNAALLQTTLPTVFCPSSVAPAATQEGFGKTSYAAVIGADATDGPGALRGVIGFDRGLAVAEIVDGTSNTIVVAEVVDGGPWFAGGSGTARRIDQWIGNRTWSNHPGGGNVVFADGSVQFLSASTDAQTLRRLATARGREPLDEADSQAAARPAGPAEAEQQEGVMAPPSVTESPDQPAPPGGQRGDRADLSLRVSLETGGRDPVRFRSESGRGDLILQLQDATFARTLRWLLVCAALLIAWLVRRAAGPRRAVAVVLGLAVPIGLAGLVPLAWTPLLDGLLLGSLAAAVLWLLPWMASTVRRWMSTASTTAALVLIAIGVPCADGAGAAAEDRSSAARPPSTPTARVGRPDLTLFIPYDPEQGQPLQSAQAYMPHDEYLRLWRQAHPDALDDVPPAVRTLVSHAEYSGRLDDEVARFEGRLVVHHLGDGWARVRLPLGKVGFEKVEIDGEPATLAADESAIYLNEPGSHVIDVRFSVPVSRLGATGQMTVPLQPVAAGRLLFELPADELDVQVKGCPGGWWRQSSGGGRGRSAGSRGAELDTESPGRFVNIPLGAASELSIRWQPQRVSSRADQLVSVDQTVLAEVLDSGVHLHGTFHYRVQQGALSRLLLRVPPDWMVQRVHGADVADWSIETDDTESSDAPARRLVIGLKAELSTGTDVTVQCFRRDRRVAGLLRLQTLEPLGVARETGRLVLGSSGPFRVRVEQASGLDQVNHVGLELPQSPREGGALFAAYRYNARPWQLQLRVVRRRARVDVSARSAVTVTSREAIVRSLFAVRVDDVPLTALRLRLPAAFRVSEVIVPEGADWFVDRDAEGQQLKVQSDQPILGDLELEISGSLARDGREVEFVVPRIVVAGATTRRGQLAIYVDDDLRAVLVNSGSARSVNPEALDGVPRPDPDRPVDYAFRYESPPKELRLRLTPAAVRVNGQVTTVVSVRDGAMVYFSNVDFEVRQAGCARFRLATPPWLGDDIALRCEHARQIRSAVTEDGRIWDIELQRAVRGAYRVQLVQSLPLPDDGVVPAAVIRPLGVERLRSHVVLENLTMDEIVATTTDAVTPIPLESLPDGLTEAVRRQAVAAYRVSGEEANLVWQRRVREQETGLAASINLADLTTVIQADGNYRARAAYSIRNFTLQFLELELPPDSEVWSVHVSGEPVRPASIERQGRSVTLLPLQKTSAGDFSSKVILVYAGHLGKPLSRWGQVHPPAPRIIGDVPVSRTLWTVLLPNEYQAGLVEGDSNLEAVPAAYHQQERRLSFLDELRQMVQVASSKGKTAAGVKARYNLEQVGSALEIYAQGGARPDAAAADEVQQQAQQIEAEIERLETLARGARRAELDSDAYFQSRTAEPDDAPVAEPPPGRAKQRRGHLREQVEDQLERLKSLEQEEPAQEPVPPPEAGEPGPPSRERAAVELPAAPTGAAARDRSALTERALSGVGAGTGRLSLDLELALAGTAYHFRKLQGAPRLVLSARHESVARLLIALLWSGLCLLLAAAAIYGLTRPHAAAFCRRHWPWLAAVAGTVWLFLLPAGVFGWALLVTSACVLIARSR